MRNRNALIVRMSILLSVPAGVSASDERPSTEKIFIVREATFFNSEPVYREKPLASFPKRSPPDRLMENVGGLYYIVDASSFVKADTDRSGGYRALGKTVLVDETLLSGETTKEK